MIKYLLPFIIFVVIISFFWQGLNKDPHKVPSVLIGKPVPGFKYASLEHADKSITNQVFLGHVSLLNVWATWCISCRAEHPVLMDIAQSNRVVLYGLNYKDDRNAAIDWLAKFGNPYRDIIFDHKGELAINFGVYGSPETFVIDRNGVIRYKYIGPISPTAWEEEILPVIEKLE